MMQDCASGVPRPRLSKADLSHSLQYMPHTSEAVRVKLIWQFRIHNLVTGRPWSILMLLCVAGSIGMLASETSYMSQVWVDSWAWT